MKARTIRNTFASNDPPQGMILALLHDSVFTTGVAFTVGRVGPRFHPGRASTPLIQSFAFMLRRRSLVVLAAAVCLLAVGWTRPAWAQIRSLASPNVAEYARFGAAVAPVADVDGDGASDVIVGAPSEGPDQLGRVHLFHGASEQPLQTFSSPNAEKRGDFGAAVAGLADVDEDGAADVAVGAPRESTGRRDPQAGRVYFFSSAGEELEDVDSPNDQPNGRFGFSLASIGDVDGDGMPDVIAGAPSEVVSEEDQTTGRVYLLTGTDGDDLLELEPPQPGTRLFGYAVSPGGDADRDGTPDVLVGAVGASAGTIAWAGGAYLFSGSTGNLLFSVRSPSPVKKGRFGSSVARVPDANGDGVDDLLVGAPGEQTEAGSEAGRAYLFSGRSGSLLHTLTSPEAQSSGRFGTTVAGVGDVNGDGSGDVLVGGPDEASSAGRLHLFSGADGTPLATLASPKDALNGSFSAALGTADVDGDGTPDVLVGAMGEKVGDVKNAGLAYVVDGASLVSETPPAN